MFVVTVYLLSIISGRNEVVAKVMFLLVSVILSTGGYTPPRHTVNARPVRILLECILVVIDFVFTFGNHVRYEDWFYSIMIFVEEARMRGCKYAPLTALFIYICHGEMGMP